MWLHVNISCWCIVTAVLTLIKVGDGCTRLCASSLTVVDSYWNTNRKSYMHIKVMLFCLIVGLVHSHWLIYAEGVAQQSTNSWKGVFSVSSYTQYFNVDTDIVLNRVNSSLFPSGDFFSKIDANPDLWVLLFQLMFLHRT